MRLPSATTSTTSTLLALASLAAGCDAFHHAPPTITGRRRHRSRRAMPPALPAAAEGGVDGSGVGGVGRKVLTAADVMSRAKSKIENAKMDGGLNDQPVPKLFLPEVYDDFQNTLLLLERRVTSGKGCLSVEDLDIFEKATSNIVNEMKEYLADPVGCGNRIAKAYDSVDPVASSSSSLVDASSVPVASPATAVASAATTTIAIPSPAAPAPAPAPWMMVGPPPPRRGEPGGGKYARPAAAASSSVVAPSRAPPSPTVHLSAPPRTAPVPSVVDSKYGDEDDADNVGFGLARGTTNTYVIPDMESMSPEEYREKLQETISARQAERRRLAMENSNIIGNRSSSGYLDGLNGGGDGTNGGGGSMYRKTSWKKDG